MTTIKNNNISTDSMIVSISLLSRCIIADDHLEAASHTTSTNPLAIAKNINSGLPCNGYLFYEIMHLPQTIPEISIKDANKSRVSHRAACYGFIAVEIDTHKTIFSRNLDALAILLSHEIAIPISAEDMEKTLMNLETGHVDGWLYAINDIDINSLITDERESSQSELT